MYKMFVSCTCHIYIWNTYVRDEFPACGISLLVFSDEGKASILSWPSVQHPQVIKLKKKKCFWTDFTSTREVGVLFIFVMLGLFFPSQWNLSPFFPFSKDFGLLLSGGSMYIDLFHSRLLEEMLHIQFGDSRRLVRVSFGPPPQPVPSFSPSTTPPPGISQTKEGYHRRQSGVTVSHAWVTVPLLVYYIYTSLVIYF